MDEQLHLCPVCRNRVTKELFNAIVMNKHRAVYRFCDKCQILFVENPKWLNEAYKKPINIYDTGIVSRNLNISRKAATIIYFLFKRDARFLDYAGGYGIFTRLMRDIGFNFYWHDPYSTNLLSRGFELGNHTSNFELLTCFEVLEHLVEPISEIEKMFRFSKNILLSTQLLPCNLPKPGEWSYYGLEHGQHVSFYSLKTLQFIAERFDCKLYSYFKDLYLLTQEHLNTSRYDLLLKFFGNDRLFAHAKKRLKSKTDDDSRFLASMEYLKKK